jgi:acetoacetyl-CoA synthetase
MDGIEDAVVVGRPADGDIEIILCIKLTDNLTLNSDLEQKIKKSIRSKTTPRHVPRYIFEVHEIPYTISGKKVEKAVLSTILGKEVMNKDALANPQSLKEYSNLLF